MSVDDRPAMFRDRRNSARAFRHFFDFANVRFLPDALFRARLHLRTSFRFFVVALANEGCSVPWLVFTSSVFGSGGSITRFELPG